MKSLLWILVVCCVGLVGLTVFAWTNRYNETQKVSELVKEIEDLNLQIRGFKSTIRFQSDIILGKISGPGFSPEIQKRMRLLRTQIIKQGH
jgi:hypothetical protein